MTTIIKLPKYTIYPLIISVSLAVLNVSLISPALPAMRNYYSISVYQSQLIVIIFIIGYAICQLLFGTLANIFGYRKCLILGLTIGTIGSIICVLSYYVNSYSILILGRFIDGLGISAGLVLSFAVIHDFYKDKKAKSCTTYCLMSLALVPAFANLIGGYLTFNFGFILCFYFLVIYNAAACLFCIILPKILNDKKVAFISISNILQNYAEVLKNKKVVTAAILYGLCLIIIYGCIITLPFIGIDYLKLNAEVYGTLFLYSYLGYFVGCLIINFTSHKINESSSIFLGILVTMIGGILLYISILLGSTNTAILFTALFIVFLGTPFIFVNTIIVGISSHKNKANASSIFNFIYALFAVVTLLFMDTIHVSLLLIVPAGIILLMIISLIIYFLTIRKWTASRR